LVVHAMMAAQHVYEVRPRKRQTRRRSNFRCAAIRSAVVRWDRCSHQPNRLRGVLQPVTSDWDSSLDVANKLVEVHHLKSNFKEP
jgi:hypothetical protein